MAEKSTKNLQEKQVIGQYAGHLVHIGDCVYLEAGSTVFEMIPYLPTDIVVVTNGMTHVDQLLDKNIKTFLIGGYAKPTTKAIIGRGALESLEHYRFDKCFIGANGIHHQFGYTTPDQEEAMIKQQAIALAREAYVLADESKFSEIAFAKIADRKSTRLNSSHVAISYAVFCWKN